MNSTKRIVNGLLATLFTLALVMGASMYPRQAHADAPPETSITSHPDNVDANTTPTFEFSVSSSVPLAETTCKIDDSPAVTCTSPYTTPTLSNGTHTFVVQAQDQLGGIDPTPATFSWTVGTPSTITGGSDVSGITNFATPITDIQVNGEGALPVHLEVPSGVLYMTNLAGLTFTSDTSGSVLDFSGSVSALNAALATLHYSTDQEGEVTLSISIKGSNQVMYGNHAYEVISGECDEGGPGCISWDDAKTAAEARTYLGVQGYLASITSDEENSYLAQHLTGGASWIGSSDSVEEGTWRWVGGPDDGLHFWTGEGEYGGATEPGQYSNWNPGEPNNSGDNEDCGEMYAGDSSGQWNDLPCNEAILGSYMVEYGNDEHPITIPSHTLTITTTRAIADDMTINDCEQLQAIDDLSNTYGATYTLAHDIDCSMTNPDSSNFDPDGTWGDGLGFRPIGSTNTAFDGELDGGDYTITGLYINRDSQGQVGLFSEATSDSYVHNLNLADAHIVGGNDTGSLAGDGYGDVSNVAVSAEVIGTGSYTGGLVGYAEDADFSNVHVSGSVYAEDDESGGIIGQYDGGVLSDCSFSGDITSYYESGGIIGENEGSVVIHRCYSEGSITADDTDTGGIVGEVEGDITVDESFSTMDVFGDDAGGIIGTVYGSTTLSNSYFNGSVGGPGDSGSVIGYVSSSEDLSVTNVYGTGPVSGDSNVAGFTGDPGEGNTYTNSFWDTQTTGFTDGCDPSDGCDGVLGKTTSEMQNIATYTSNLGNEAWDFDTVWTMAQDVNDGYPCLRWYALCTEQDGVPANVEDAAPNNGDANGDSMHDSEQANVTSFINALTGQYMALETSCASNFNVQNGGESSEDKDPAYDYNAGLIGFVGQDCGQQGVTVTVKLYYYGTFDPATLVLRKWGNNTYTTISGATLSQTAIDGQPVLVATYQITDGGPLDQDGIADGNIVDPVGLGTQVVGAPNTGLGGKK